MMQRALTVCMVLGIAGGCGSSATAPRLPPLPPAVPVMTPLVVLASPPAAHVVVAAPARPATPQLMLLPLEQGEDAVVSVPPGEGAKPVLVVAHGAGGRALDHCELWQRVAGRRAFILCPSGFRMYPPEAERFFYDGHPALAAEITRALAALRARYGKRIDGAAPFYAGYSQGAGMGAMLLPKHAAKFAGAVLVEGGVGQMQEWNVQVAQQFHAAGGRRVVLACGRRVCVEHARRTTRYMRQAGLEVTLVYTPGAGHNLAGPVFEQVADAFEWLVAQDPRWQSP